MHVIDNKQILLNLYFLVFSCITRPSKYDRRRLKITILNGHLIIQVITIDKLSTKHENRHNDIKKPTTKNLIKEKQVKQN